MSKQSLNRKPVRLFLAIVLVALILSGANAVFASAEDAFVDLVFYSDMSWSSDGADVQVSNGSSTTDFFGVATKNLAPGMVRTITIRLTNQSESSQYFRLLAIPRSLHSAQGVPGALFPVTRSSDELMNEINVAVYYQGSKASTKNEIYVGKFAGRPDAEMYFGAGATLGTLAAGETGTITVRVEIPGTLDNSYMAAQGALDWRFTATEVTSGSEDAGKPQEGTDGAANIQSTALPLADASAEVEPPDEIPEFEVNPVPRDDSPVRVIAASLDSSLPQTGGVRTFVVVLSIMLLLLIALLAVTYIKGRDGKGRKAEE